jgi:glycosyltransferase involved in cell wall biosynthesis
MKNSQPASRAAARPDIAVFIPSFGDGGVERMLVNLSGGFASRGVKVDFLVKDRSGPYIPLLPEGVRIVTTGTTRSRELVRFLEQYLAEEVPRVLMSAKKCDREAIVARRRAGAPTKIFLRIGTTVSRRDENRPLKRFFAFRRMRSLYPQADGLIAVSQGVAEDVAKITGISREAIQVIRNPVVTPQLAVMAGETAAHPWFSDGGPTVILGVGGLRWQKDFATLLKAFARVRREYPCRLMILGTGHLESSLRELARELAIEADFDLPGFVRNPYPYMRQARLFVLSSAWEGSPNVLTEALAVGTPVVATDCPSGPREILDGGRIAPLVKVGDVDGMAAAMLSVLRQPPARELLQEAVRDYTQELSSRRYLEVFGLV